MQGIVTDIQRFSIHDGPGIRTTVFLKGCNLRCFWCHNPETWSPKPELQVFPDKCIGCGACLEVCPNNAHIMVDGQKVFLREKCTGCGQCADVCYAEALVLVGKSMTVDEVLNEVLQDKAFYDNSGGGITLSGGEPALQLEFSYNLLARAQQAGLHTAIETDANYRWENLEHLLEVTDYVMSDIKHTNSWTHKQATGVPNERIFDNHRKLMGTAKPVVFRTPVIPTINADDDNICAIAQYVRELSELRNEHNPDAPPPRLELLPFHKLAADKFRSLGLDYKAINLNAPSTEDMEHWTALAQDIYPHIIHR